MRYILFLHSLLPNRVSPPFPTRRSSDLIENSINGATGIGSLRSRSIQGLSDITVVFRAGTDIYRDRQLVAERLSAIANELPTDRKSTRLNSSHRCISYAVFCLKKKKIKN